MCNKSFNKPKIVQHISNYDQIGGPASQLRRILNSRLSNEFLLTVISQDKPARGINLGLILSMARKFKNIKPDLIHIRGLQNEGFHGVMAAKLSGCKKIIVSVHGFAEDATIRSDLRRFLLTNILEPLTLICAQHVYCVCNSATHHKIIQRYASKKLSIIYNGIEISSQKSDDGVIRKQFNVEKSEVMALYVGRISRDKGLIVLAEALKKIPNPPLLWIVGEGPDFEIISEAFKPLTKIGKVRFLGRQNNIPELLSACDFFVFPSFHENLSNAILEAMLANKAVLTTNVGGNPEIVLDGITGILIPPNDSDTLADNIRMLSENPELCSQMGLKGRERVESVFSLDQTITKLSSLYSSLLSK